MPESIRMSEVVRPPSTHKPETPEGVALELMEMIFFNEVAKPTRDEILSTYAECLRATKGTYKERSEKYTREIAALGDELAESRPTSVERLNHKAV